jgi:hypothetical protein
LKEEIKDSRLILVVGVLILFMAGHLTRTQKGEGIEEKM